MPIHIIKNWCIWHPCCRDVSIRQDLSPSIWLRQAKSGKSGKLTGWIGFWRFRVEQEAYTTGTSHVPVRMHCIWQACTSTNTTCAAVLYPSISTVLCCVTYLCVLSDYLCCDTTLLSTVTAIQCDYLCCDGVFHMSTVVCNYKCCYALLLTEYSFILTTCTVMLYSSMSTELHYYLYPDLYSSTGTVYCDYLCYGAILLHEYSN